MSLQKDPLKVINVQSFNEVCDFKIADKVHIVEVYQ